MLLGQRAGLVAGADRGRAGPAGPRGARRMGRAAPPTPPSRRGGSGSCRGSGPAPGRSRGRAGRASRVSSAGRPSRVSCVVGRPARPAPAHAPGDGARPRRPLGRRVSGGWRSPSARREPAGPVDGAGGEGRGGAPRRRRETGGAPVASVRSQSSAASIAGSYGTRSRPSPMRSTRSGLAMSGRPIARRSKRPSATAAAPVAGV